MRSSRRRAHGLDRGLLWAAEFIGWALWVLAVFGSGILLVVGQSTAAFYLLALWVASGFALIVWNVWVLLAEVEE